MSELNQQIHNRQILDQFTLQAEGFARSARHVTGDFLDVMPRLENGRAVYAFPIAIYAAEVQPAE
jgi:hypothetical protein